MFSYSFGCEPLTAISPVPKVYLEDVIASDVNLAHLRRRALNRETASTGLVCGHSGGGLFLDW